MKLNVIGNINQYYVQTLCMIFFPGEKFSEKEEADGSSPELSLSLAENENAALSAPLPVFYVKRGSRSVRFLP